MRIILDDSELLSYIEKNIVSYYKRNSLFPFLGAGFTKGSKSKRGSIPNGSETKAQMKSLILSVSPELRQELDTVEDFDKVANLFYKLVSKSEISDFLSNNFTNTQLDEIRSSFINLNWPYIYTLNIDDAIERNSNLIPILPNKQIQKKYLAKNVFKLHGDANDEINYINRQEGIIFSRKQYLQSLIDNKDLLNIFLEDYASFNFIFIGCSLDNELDLEYILANNKSKYPKQTDKIYVTTTAPTALTKLKLEDFGINVCLVVKSYSFFYEQLISNLKEVEFNNDNPFDQYLIKNIIESNNKDFNKKIICGEAELTVINNSIEVPEFFIHREITDTAINLLNGDNILFIVGKRVSGKTFFIYDLIRSIKNRNIYFFPSQISIDTNLIDSISKLQESILVFDTDTLAPSDVEDIYYNHSTTNKSSTKFVFCINSSDRLMLSIPYSKIIDAEIIELNNILSKSEILIIDEKLSKLGLIKFHKNQNILNNIFRYREVYGTSSLADSFYSEIDPKTLKIYILNAAFDKVYSSLYRALKIDYDNIKFAVEKSKSAIEFEYFIADLELGQHSTYKVITNSKTFLFAVLGNYISKPENLSSAASAVVDIVEKLREYDSFKNSWKSLIAFDTLNQIFYKQTGGAINLIFSIYNKLETLLYNDTHFWMQRAKSIFYLKRTSVSELKKAIEYTKKVYYDSNELSRIRINASFQIAMIYNRVIVLENFRNNETLRDAISWICIGLKENMHNTKFINDFLEVANKEKFKNDFYAIAMYIFDNPQSATKEEREFILSKIFVPGFKDSRK
jgi:hypothetical protein